MMSALTSRCAIQYHLFNLPCTINLKFDFDNSVMFFMNFFNCVELHPRWYVGEPNNSQDEDCVEALHYTAAAHLWERIPIGQRPTSGYWLNDKHCSETNYVVCEQRTPYGCYEAKDVVG